MDRGIHLKHLRWTNVMVAVGLLISVVSARAATADETYKGTRQYIGDCPPPAVYADSDCVPNAVVPLKSPLAPPSSHQNEFPESEFPESTFRARVQPSLPTPSPVQPSPAPATSTPPNIAPTPSSSGNDFSSGNLSSGLASNFGSGGSTSLAFADTMSSGGYIDSAVVRNQIRFRFDASYDNPTPDRAEFFYPKCGCFGGAAPGPLALETGVDYQEFSFYLETLLLGDLVSAFVELPYRWIDPEVNRNAFGIGDVNFGFKLSLLNDENTHVTFQMRTIAPSGDGRLGLGTEHATIEPGLLIMQRFDCGINMETELRDFIPIDGTKATATEEDWAGNVLRYGVGFWTTAYESNDVTLSPVVETVAWSVLGGQVLDNGNVTSAETTIANMKFGLRLSDKPHRNGRPSKSLYLGYGKSLTDTKWYDDTVRVEYRILF